MPICTAIGVFSITSGWLISPIWIRKAVQQTVFLQYADPGIDADQRRGPERQDDQHDQHRLNPLGCAGHDIGHRIADQQAQRIVVSAAMPIESRKPRR